MCFAGDNTVFGILLDAAEVGMAGYELWGSLLPAYDELKELRSNFAKQPSTKEKARPCVSTCCWSETVRHGAMQ